jgi:threonine/homoserine/homoserine lactone efflux protein
MVAGSTCPTGFIHEAQNPSSLLKVGASMNTSIPLEPDWALLGICFLSTLLMMLFLAVTIGYIYNKNWDQNPMRTLIGYQINQYVKVARSEVTDPKALVSINSDASAF